jgi:hypothetical protein
LRKAERPLKAGSKINCVSFLGATSFGVSWQENNKSGSRSRRNFGITVRIYKYFVETA